MFNQRDFQIGHEKVIFLLSCLASLIVASSTCEYQRIDAGHTMCIYSTRSCTGKTLIRSGGITCQEKQIILEAHNRLRQKLALGQVRGQPPSLDMRELVWDDELALVSQRWADQCTAGHDRRRAVDRFSVGQNVAATWTFDKPSPFGEDPEFKRQIDAWFDEVNKFHSQDIKPFSFNHHAGHYTQIAWSETYTVGCGYTYYKDAHKGYTKLYVCNYGPGGNVIGSTMYRIGRPGQTMCINEGLSSSHRYPGLCEITKRVDYREQACQTLPPPVNGTKVQPVIATPSPNSIASGGGGRSPTGTTAQPQPSVNEILIRGNTFSGLAKLLNPYNLFG